MNKSSKPLVTVLMAIYNSKESFLRLAIKSILKQTYQNFEFLIIDDGSNNNCLDVVKIFDDARIKIVHNSQNMKLAASLNKGIRLAQGKYIIRMDDDDISHPDRIAKQVDFMEKNPSISICGSAVKTLNKVWQPATDHDEIKCNLFFKNSIAHPSIIIRRQDLLDNNLFFNEQYAKSQDYEMWSRCIKQLKFANLADVLLDYRFSKSQLNTYFKNSKQRADQKTREKILNDLGLYPSEQEKQIHNILCTRHYCLKPGFAKQARNWIQKIKQANQNKKIYPTDIFEKKIEAQLSIKKMFAFLAKNIIYFLLLIFLKD